MSNKTTLTKQRGRASFVALAALALAASALLGGAVAAPQQASQPAQSITQSAYNSHEWLADDALPNTNRQRLALNRPLRDRAIRLTQQGSDYFHSLLSQEIGLHAFQGLLRDKLLSRNSDFNPLGNIQNNLTSTAKHLPVLTADTITDYLIATSEDQARALGFVRQIDIEYRSEVGGRKSHGGISALGALRETKDDVIAWQLRGYGGDESAIGTNMGLVYRFIPQNSNNLFGINTFFDYEDTEHGGFSRLSFGAEMRSAWVDLFANRYEPITDPQVLNDRETAYTQGGFDVAVHLHSPELRWLSGGLTYYNFTGEVDDDDETGTRLHLAADAGELALGIEGLRIYAEYDSNSDSNDRGWSSFGGGFSWSHLVDSAAQGKPARSGAAFNPRDYFFAAVNRESAQRVVVGTIAVDPEVMINTDNSTGGTYTHRNPDNSVVEQGSATSGYSFWAATAIVEFSTNTNQQIELNRGGAFVIEIYENSQMTYNGPDSQLEVASGAVYYRSTGNRRISRIVSGANITIELVGTELTVVVDGNNITLHPVEGVIEVRAAAADIATGLNIVLPTASEMDGEVRITDPATPDEAMVVDTREGLQLAEGSEGADGMLYALESSGGAVATLNIGGNFNNSDIIWDIHNNPGGYNIDANRVLNVPTNFTDGQAIIISMAGPHGLHGSQVITIRSIAPLERGNPPSQIDVYNEVDEPVLTITLSGGNGRYAGEIDDTHGNASNFRLHSRGNGEYIVFTERSATHNSNHRLIVNFTATDTGNLSQEVNVNIGLNVTPRIALDNTRLGFNARTNSTEAFGNIRALHGKGSYRYSTTDRRVIIDPTTGALRLRQETATLEDFQIPVAASDGHNTARANVAISIRDGLSLLAGTQQAVYYVVAGNSAAPIAQLTVRGGDDTYNFGISQHCWGSRFAGNNSGVDSVALEAVGSRSNGSNCELVVTATDTNNTELDPLTVTLTLQAVAPIALANNPPANNSGINVFDDVEDALLTLTLSGDAAPYTAGFAAGNDAVSDNFILTPASDDETTNNQFILTPRDRATHTNNSLLSLQFVGAHARSTAALALRLNVTPRIAIEAQTVAVAVLEGPTNFYQVTIVSGSGKGSPSLSIDPRSNSRHGVLIDPLSGNLSFPGSVVPPDNESFNIVVNATDEAGNRAAAAMIIRILTFPTPTQPIPDNWYIPAGGTPHPETFTYQVQGGGGIFSYTPLAITPDYISVAESESVNGLFSYSIVGARFSANSPQRIENRIRARNAPALELIVTTTVQIFDQLTHAPIPVLNAYHNYATDIVTLQIQGGIGSITVTPDLPLPRGFSLTGGDNGNGIYTLAVVAQDAAAYNNFLNINIPLTFRSEANELAAAAEELKINLGIAINGDITFEGEFGQPFNPNIRVDLSQPSNAVFYTLPVRGGLGNYAYTWTSSNSALAINSDGGMLFSGANGPASNGTLLATIVATDNGGVGNSATVTLTMHIFDQLHIENNAPLNVNAYHGYGEDLLTLQIEGGEGAIAVEYATGLPNGFSFNSSGNGIYTLSVQAQSEAAYGGIEQFDIRLIFTSAANGDPTLGALATQLPIDIVVRVNPDIALDDSVFAPNIRINESVPPNLPFYEFNFFSGGKGNYLYSVSSSNSNLQFNTNGELLFGGSGGPTARGTEVVATLTATDDNGNGNDIVATLTMHVFNLLTEASVRPDINAYEGYGEDILTLQIAGGTGSYAVSHDPLPTGFSLTPTSANGAFTLSVANQTAAEYGNLDAINLQITIESEANTHPVRRDFTERLVLDLQVNVNPAFGIDANWDREHEFPILTPQDTAIYRLPITGGKGNYQVGINGGGTHSIYGFRDGGEIYFKATGRSSATEDTIGLRIFDDNGSGNQIYIGIITLRTTAPSFDLTNLHNVDSSGAANIPFVASNDTVVAQISVANLPASPAATFAIGDEHADKFEVMQGAEANQFELRAKLNEAPPQAADSVFDVELTLQVGTFNTTERITINLPTQATGGANIPTQGDIILMDHAGSFDIPAAARRGSTLTVQHHQKLYKSSDGVNWETIMTRTSILVTHGWSQAGNTSTYDNYALPPGAGLYINSNAAGTQHFINIISGTAENWALHQRAQLVRSGDGGATWDVVINQNEQGSPSNYEFFRSDQSQFVTHTRTDGSIEVVRLGGREITRQAYNSGNHDLSLSERDRFAGARLTDPTNERFAATGSEGQPNGDLDICDSNLNWECTPTLGNQAPLGSTPFTANNGLDAIHAANAFIPMRLASFNGYLYHTPQQGEGFNAPLRRSNGNPVRRTYEDLGQSYGGSNTAGTQGRGLRGAGLVVFNGFLWAFGGNDDPDQILFSSDGVHFHEVVYAANNPNPPAPVFVDPGNNNRPDNLQVTVPDNPSRFANGGRDWCNPIMLVHEDYLYVLGGGECAATDFDDPSNRIQRSKDGLTWELLDTRPSVGGTLNGYESVHLGQAAVLPN